MFSRLSNASEWKRHRLTCCGASHFRILYKGNLLRTRFGHPYVEYDENAEVVAKCAECGNEIQVVGERRDASAEHNEFSCRKCSGNSFAVNEKLELTGDEVTWREISLQCDGCKKQYRRFMEIEAD